MTANEIRNICLLGHGGSGKTTLAERMLFMTKGTDRFGKTVDGNTTCDYDAEEIKRQISISLAFAPVKYKGVRINVMDAPGNFDFSGEAVSAIRAAECAVLVGAAKDGLSVGMERSWKLLGKKPRMIFVNRTDEDNSDYQACLDALKGKFGQSVVPIVAPVIDGNKKVTGIVDLLHNTAYEVKGGKAAACAIPADMADEVEALRSELMEAAAGSDEELMEKFFDTMELSAEDMARGLKLGVRDGSVCPVLCGSAVTGLGVEMLMQTILDLVPVATDMPAETAQDDDGNDVEVACDPNGPTAAIVFIGALLAYLWSNAKPSSLLMGDAGSRAMGFFLAILALKSGHPFAFLLAALVFIVDGSLGILKISFKRFLHISILKNTLTPLHDHVRKRMGWSDEQVVARWLILQAVASALLLLMTR